MTGEMKTREQANERSEGGFVDGPVYAAETKRIEERRRLAGERPSRETDRAALCLSGGGIRSATFNLGILQGLASHDMLKTIDYLSTVSGGGYTGTCLTTLLNSPTDKVGMETDKFPLGRKKIGDADEPSIEKDPVRRLRYFSNYLTAEGGFISKYIRPAMVFVRGVVLNFYLIIPYIILLGLLLALVFNIRSLSGIKENSFFFDYREFTAILETAKHDYNLATAELRKYAVEKTRELNFADDRERVEWIMQHDASKELENLRSNIRDAKKPLREEWRQIWVLPLCLFALMTVIALFCRVCYSKPYSGRCRFNNVLAIIFFLSLFIALLQLYGILIVYWKTWNISSWITSASLLSLIGPRLIRNSSEERGRKPAITGIILAILLLMLVPLFILFLTGVVISYASKGDYAIITGFVAGILALFYINRRFINLNEISLHSYYRDCLCRAYMMQYDSTGEHLSTKDSLKFSDLKPEKGPYHIFNTTLNMKKSMPDGKDAGTFRTGESFTFSRNRFGSAKTGYVSAKEYEEMDHHMDIGTAMAVSGAAANIGMAQKNLPVLRLLMGLLNIRLGYWALHPKEALESAGNIITKKFPGSLEVFQECFGAYLQNAGYINLSDGGHFDNIGVYELLRRRCRYIIVGDAEADPDMKFEAISYIMRLARIDFGIEINIDISDIKPDPATGLSRNHCAIGRIDYPEGDYGYLVYCKASLTGDEPVHLHEYKVKHPTFPHQTTADQWFDEQQFEAYRELGYHIAKGAFAPYSKTAYSTSEDQFTRLKEFWHPHSQAVEANFSRHGAELNRIILEIKNDADLAFIDSRIYAEWESLILQNRQPVVSQADASAGLWLPSEEKQLRKGFYLCNLMMQLMENVYMDLDLEREYDHPDNRGWMNLFRKWSGSGMFRVTWAACASTFGAHFQTFCERRLGLDLGEIVIDSFNENRIQDVVEKSFDDSERGFVEKYFISGNRYLFDTIFIFSLRVTNPLNKTDFRSFHYGFALVDSNKELVFFRVQDYLRKMGLGRKTLKKLATVYNITHYNFSVLRTHNLTESNKRNIRNFEKLFMQTGLTRHGEGV